MATRRDKMTEAGSDKIFPLKREVSGLFTLAVGVFYYLCILSFSPADPALFGVSGHDSVGNLGGIIGSYLAGFFFFLFGGASYFFGLYFLINATLLFAHKRSTLKFLDFFVYLLCSAFFAIFLQLQFGYFTFDLYQVNAGGTLGKLLGEVGAEYLGRWGVYLLVVFSTIATFTVATRLSLVEALGSSTAFLGKGAGVVGNRFVILLGRVTKFVSEHWKTYQVARLAKKAQAVLDEEDEHTIKVNLNKRVKETPKPAATKPVNPVKESKEEPKQEQSIENMLDGTQAGEVKILERKDQKIKKPTEQMELVNVGEGYQLPPLAFLDYEDTGPAEVDPESLKMSAMLLESKLKDFFIEGRVTEIHPGPVITMYEFQPAPGVKLSRINSLTDDLSLAMGGRPVRIVSPLPNKAAIGIEIPNHTRETVWLKDIIADDRFQKVNSKMTFAIGKDIEGIPFVADLQKMPHLLVAGSTGSGKSVSINTMVCSILYNARPDEVRMIMIDPKMIELSIYEGIPHLLLPVVTDPKKANLALKWGVREMERRYKLLADVNARNLESYNKKIEAGEFENKIPDIDSDESPAVHQGKLPYIVIIIDEFADLMMVSSKEVEESVCRLAQKARAAGIHVILATQRPSVDVITGIIKANFPSRIAFRVTSRHDSRTILDGNGAEHLLGMGDMLFVPPGANRVTRLHGAYISEKEIVRIVEFLKAQVKPVYNEEILKAPEGSEMGVLGGEDGEGLDEFYDRAVQIVSETKRVSISSIQRQFRIGYNRAARIVELMEQQGVVSSPNGQGQRQVLAGEI